MKHPKDILPILHMPNASSTHACWLWQSLSLPSNRERERESSNMLYTQHKLQSPKGQETNPWIQFIYNSFYCVEIHLVIKYFSFCNVHKNVSYKICRSTSKFNHVLQLVFLHWRNSCLNEPSRVTEIAVGTIISSKLVYKWVAIEMAQYKSQCHGGSQCVSEIQWFQGECRSCG